MTLKRFFLWSLIISFALAAVLGVAAVILPSWGRREEILITTVIFGGFSLVCLACAQSIEKRVLRALMWAGIASSAGAFLIWMLILWGVFSIWGYVDETLIKSGATLTFFGVFAAHVAVLMTINAESGRVRATRTAAVACSALFTLILTGGMWAEEFDGLWQVLAVLGIVGGCCTLIAPIMAKVESIKRRESAEPMLRDKVEIDLSCPRCGERQMVRAGESRCRACKLKFTIEVEEPLCACGYQLFGLTGEKCPECGRVIPAEERWRGSEPRA